MLAPFPYFGGKRRWADRVWQRLGSPTVYSEPCAGSLAVLLAKPNGPAEREIVSDTDGYICNFWRAVQASPRTVARWADWPTIHQDLTARHCWLLDWGERNSGRLSEDPEWYDAKAAGWWVWGLSLWIGGGWCASADTSRPHVNSKGGGLGVSRQRTFDQVPHVKNFVGGQGISRQTVRRAFDKRPYVHNSVGGRGVSTQRTQLANGRRVRHLDNIVEVFEALQVRLANTVVLNRSWQSAVTPTLLQHTPRSPQPAVAIFFDPPYVLDERNKGIYRSDIDRVSDGVAQEIYDWMLTPGSVPAFPELPPGEVYRIAYCCGVGDFALPAGWTAETETFGGIRTQDRRTRRDMVMFSPPCLVPQPSLFGGVENVHG